MAAASTSTSDAAERLARLVQRLRRLVRGGLILVGGHARLQPQDETDVATALALARELAVPVMSGSVFPAHGTFPPASSSRRGGLQQGTDPHGLDPAGESVPHAGRPGLQIDASAHLTRAARFDGARGMIEVQPGVRLADLNRLLQPHGWWLPIETCPDSGATLGGLTGLDAAAAAPVWGTLADRLLGIDAILDDGTRQLFGPFGERSSVSLNSGRAGQLVSALFGIAAGVQADIARHWPPGRRVPDGYLLDVFHPRPQRPYTPDGAVNLAHLLAGSAGTLAWSARLHLRLLRRPAASRWALFLQPSAVAALAHAPAVLALQPSAALLLNADDLQRLAASGHPDDRALSDLAGVKRAALRGEGERRQGQAAHQDGTGYQKNSRSAVGPGGGERLREGGGPAAWLVRFSGETDAEVQADHRRLAALLDPQRQAGATGLMLRAGGGLQSHVRSAGEAGQPAAAGRRRDAPDDGVAPARGYEQPESQLGRAAAGMPVWQRLLGELVSPRPLNSLQHLSSGVALPLPPQEPAALAGLVTALDDRLAAHGAVTSWRGQVASGELQWVVPEAAVPLARQAMQATLPPRWTPALQQAFAQVRRQFDPTGILQGGG